MTSHLFETAKASVEHPSYDRTKLKVRMCHIGFGAFHRAHQAVYTDQLLGLGQSNWAYREIELMGPTDLLDGLASRDYLYSVVENGAEEQKARIVGSVIDHRHMAKVGPEGIVAAIADEDIALVSITVTEKGYTLSSSGGLDFENPMIKSDLATPDAPHTVVGVLVAALAKRRDAGLAPFTVLSCDNLPANGHMTKRAVLDFAKALDEDLAAWIESDVRFPSTMVDRIVPAMTEESHEVLASCTGYADPAGILCEPFRQWVIEDTFTSGRPDWDLAGATFTKDVMPFENMKLRMLNGSHSFLAYLGYLGGYETIAETMGDAAYKKVARDLIGLEQAPTLVAPENVDLEVYADALIERYCNPNIRHRTWQIAMDGSQKLPQRALESIAHHLKAGTPYPRLALLVAGWMRYVGGVDEQGQPIDVRDPLADKLKALASAGTAEDVVSNLIDQSGIFPDVLAGNATFREAVATAYKTLKDKGAKQAVALLA
ncbi:fructuronate reductase [uncultured Cohaesibacter sp.]|uniref:mannitol dehydrogenase family protein n=1 Tax=uncultured Cohaesibacter sp. TaxID=1002546 RepID=UPI00292F76CF|nr:fructuronate reductase [uncultured Cohaesibacter sp.]